MQEFKDFELIVVDALHAERPDYFKQFDLPFPVVHLPPKPNPWHERKLWAVATQFNTGILHARGELVVTIGDCSQLPPHLLRRFWEEHQKGYACQAMLRYYKGVGNNDKASSQRDAYLTRLNPQWDMTAVRRSGEPVVDSRWKFVEGAGGRMEGRMDQWWYGYGAAPMKWYLKVNGFDEAFDGCKSLEDCDLGSRFEMAGYRKLILATDMWAVEYAHNPVSEKVCEPGTKPMKANWGILQWNRKAKRFRANTGQFSQEALDFIKAATRSPQCSYVGGSDYDLGEGFDWWAANVPDFDLQKERERTLKL